MSGDVFGNGMLLSQHIRLLAAFDHRHIFIDPDPDAATSWQERKRLFDLPRSSWEDYDTSLISAGGGVYSREQKSIPISAEARRALGIDDDVTELTPPALDSGRSSRRRPTCCSTAASAPTSRPRPSPTSAIAPTTRCG